MQATLPVTFDPALGSRLLRNQGHKEMVWEAVKKNNDPFCPSTPGAELWTGAPLANARICGQLETSDDFMSRRQPPPPSEPKTKQQLVPPGSYEVHNNCPLPPSRPFFCFSPNRPPSSSSRCCCRPRRGATPDLVFGGFHSSFAPPHPHRTWHPRRPLCETPSPRPRLALLSDSRASSHASRHPTTTTVDGLWPGEYEKVVALLSSVEAVPHWKHRKLATVNSPPPPSSS